MKILILGNGYIGNRCKEVWGQEATLSTKRIHSSEDIETELKSNQYDVVLNAIGTKGHPNIDWCESHKLETYIGNTLVPLMIAEACAKHNVYLLHIGSGCVFYGRSPDKNGWREDDVANPISYYSKTKYAADLVLSSLPNVGIARIRIPLDNRSCPENIIDKLIKYQKIIDVSNSITYIPDAINVFYMLMMNQSEGIFHVVNPIPVKYKTLAKMIGHDPEWISEQELVKQNLVKKLRSTAVLQSTKKIEMVDSDFAMYCAIQGWKNDK